MSKPVYVAAVGDAHDPVTWSGIPFHMTQAGRETGFIADGLRLDTLAPAWKRRRVAWNLGRLALLDRPGGYQYSTQFLERLWESSAQALRASTVINCFQLFPPSILADPGVEKWHYIDLTLLQLFDYYHVRESIGVRIGADALRRERQGYCKVEGIITMSRFAARSVTDDYGIAEDRVHIVVPGANLDPAAYRDWEMHEVERRLNPKPGGDSPLRLVMVVTHWQRKGLDRLLRALQLGRHQGLRAYLRVIGIDREAMPRDLAATEGVEWLGRINKRHDGKRFLFAVADADIGCLFPSYEAGGSVLREYHALGLGVLATNAGGMPDFMFDEASVKVDANASDAEICAELVRLERSPSLVSQLRSNAWSKRHAALWPESVRQLQDVLCAAGRPRSR